MSLHPGAILAALTPGPTLDAGSMILIAAAGLVIGGAALIWLGRTRAAHEDAAHAAARHEIDELKRLTAELTRELDGRAARLESLINRAERTQHAFMPAPEPERPAPASPSDPGQQQVHQLADMGLAPVEIARRLQIPTGQVELILSLRARTAAPGV